MGIQGLLRFIKEATKEIHIREYAGRCVAVDTYCWLHRGAFACADKLAKGEKTDLYIKYCLKYIDMLESYNVRPILVFDGCHLPSKHEVEKQRHERRQLYMQKGKQFLREGKLSEARDAFTKCISVTPEMALSVMEVVRARGIDCIVSPYEADAQLAFLLKNGYAQAVITEDSDLLCFGCETVILKMDLTGRAQEVSLSRLENVKALTGFTVDNFRHMCILSGCDYLPSIKGVGLGKSSKALKLAKNKDMYQVVRRLHQYIKGLAPVEAEYAAGFEKADKTFLYQLVFDPKIRRLVPLCPYPASIAEEDLTFAGPAMTDERALQIALGNININTGKRMGNFDADNWLKSKDWRNNRMNTCSIWENDYLSENQQTANKETTGDCKHQNERAPNLRGREVIINMHRYSFSAAKKQMDAQSYSEQDAIDKWMQAEPVKETEITKMQCDTAFENDMSELLDAYKTSLTKKTGLRHRMRRKHSGSDLEIPNCVVKSRFFATADNNSSFVEEESKPDITYIDETPENSNSSQTNEVSAAASNDKELENILEELETSFKSTNEASLHQETATNRTKRKNPFSCTEDFESKAESRNKQIFTPLFDFKRRKRKVLKPPSIQTQSTTAIDGQLPNLNSVNVQYKIDKDDGIDRTSTKNDSHDISANETTEQNLNVSSISTEAIPYLDGQVKDVEASDRGVVERLSLNVTNSNKGLMETSYKEFVMRVTHLKKDKPQKEDKTIVLSSDEENIPYIDDVQARPSKRQKTLGIRRSISAQNAGFVNSAKKFSGSSTRGRSKRNLNAKQNKSQPKITSIFTTMPASQMKMHSKPIANTIDLTPESEEEIEKIKSNMLATRRLFKRVSK